MKPVLITRESRAATAAGKWREQYHSGGEWKLYPKVDGKGTYDRLVALGPSPKPEAVIRVIGNDSWVRTPECDACGWDDGLAPRIMVGQPPDYESNTACLCFACVKEVAALLPGEDK